MGGHWCADETLLEIDGRWRYVFHTMDEQAQVVEVHLSDHHDAASAHTFSEPAIRATGVTPARATSNTANC